MALVIYGSLYPWDFHVPVHVANPLWMLLHSASAQGLLQRRMLADLIISAANIAISKARDEVAKASSNIAQELGMPLPPGGLPGF